MGDITVIEVLRAILSADVEAVSAALHLGHHRADKLAVLGEHVDSVVLLRLCTNRVRNVDVASKILGDSVGVAPREAFGRHDPIVLHAVGEVARTSRHVTSKKRGSECV